MYEANKRLLQSSTFSIEFSLIQRLVKVQNSNVSDTYPNNYYHVDLLETIILVSTGRQ